MIDDGARRSSQEIFLNLEKEHTRISPQVGIAGNKSCGSTASINFA